MQTKVFENPLVTRLIDLALEEDNALQDATSLACFPAALTASANIVARQDMIACGLGVIAAIAARFDDQMTIETFAKDADPIEKGTVLASLNGKAQVLMALERTFLNFLQRMCGVATFTHSFSKTTKLKLFDTRKTIPGWRILDKYAVTVGGGFNHRMNLAELIMIKDTHGMAVGGLTNALTTVFKNKPEKVDVEVEVASLSELAEVLEFPIKIVMLDNFTNANIVDAVKLVRGRAPNVLIEVSGGVNQARLAELEYLGVDYVSIGALTTRAVNADIALEVVI